MRDNNKKRNVTMKDVAEACNVSISTVSLVLSQDERIPPDTRKKVLTVVKSFGYRPNILAKNFSKQSTMTIACAMPYEGFMEKSPYYAEILKNIYESSSHHGYRLIYEMMTSQFVRRRFSLRLFKERAIDGMIVVLPQLSDMHLADLAGYKDSVALIGSAVEGTPLFAAMPDNLDGGYLATRHLIELGHKRIGFLSEPNSLSFKERYTGFEKAMKEYGLTVDPRAVVHASYKLGESLSGPLRILGTGATAIFAANDLLALEAIKTLKAMGKKVPEDVSVVGMDGLTLGQYSDPALSTVRVPLDKMADAAIKYLTVKQEQHKSREIFKVELIERATTQRLAS